MSFPAALMTAVEHSCRWRFTCHSDGHGNGWKCLRGFGSILKLLCSCVFLDNPGVLRCRKKKKNRCFVIYDINFGGFLSAALCSDHMFIPPSLVVLLKDLISHLHLCQLESDSTLVFTTVLPLQQIETRTAVF